MAQLELRILVKDFFLSHTSSLVNQTPSPKAHLTPLNPCCGATLTRGRSTTTTPPTPPTCARPSQCTRPAAATSSAAPSSNTSPETRDGSRSVGDDKKLITRIDSGIAQGFNYAPNAYEVHCAHVHKGSKHNNAKPKSWKSHNSFWQKVL